MFNWFKRRPAKQVSRSMRSEICPICTGMALHYDAVDFNRTCEVPSGGDFEHSGRLIDYFCCLDCAFCFAPEMLQWTPEQLSELVYNDAYALADPEFAETRPRASFSGLERMFGAHGTRIKHLDYGGGAGLLSTLLLERGWDSRTYDPFFQEGPKAALDGKFDLITVFEVLEHSTDPHGLVKTLSNLRAPDGLIFVSTATNDGNIVPGGSLTWNYAAPRNGHVSLFSQHALRLLAEANGMWCSSANGNFHFFGVTVPDWATGAIRMKDDVPAASIG